MGATPVATPARIPEEEPIPAIPVAPEDHKPLPVPESVADAPAQTAVAPVIVGEVLTETDLTV
jgi:hypothetical protein